MARFLALLFLAGKRDIQEHQGGNHFLVLLQGPASVRCAPYHKYYIFLLVNDYLSPVISSQQHSIVILFSF